MAKLHIWETNFENYIIEVPLNITYTYVPPPHAGFFLKSVWLDGKVVEAPYSFAVTKEYQDLTAEFALIVVPPPPPPPPPPTGSMGHCFVSSYPSSFGDLYSYGRGSGEKLGSGFTSYQAAEYSASQSAQCQIAPVAPSVPVTRADLDAAAAVSLKQTEQTGSMLLNIISTTASTIFDAASQYADDLFASVGTKLSEMRTDIETNMITPLTSAIEALWGDIGALWTSLEEVVTAAEAEVTARVKAISDLETGIKTWIAASAFEMVLKNLDAGTSTWRKKQS